MYQELLQQIEQEAATFGETLEKPIEPQQLEALKREAEGKLNYALPQDYIELLKLYDGLACGFPPKSTKLCNNSVFQSVIRETLQKVCLILCLIC